MNGESVIGLLTYCLLNTDTLHPLAGPVRTKKKAADLAINRFLEFRKRRLLRVFFLRVALFAGLAFFLGFDAALVRALLTGGLGLIAAGFRLDADRAENCQCASCRDE